MGHDLASCLEGEFVYQERESHEQDMLTGQSVTDMFYQICSNFVKSKVTQPTGDRPNLVAGTLRRPGGGESKYSMEASHKLLTSKMWTAIRHFQPGSLPGPAELLPGKAL